MLYLLCLASRVYTRMFEHTTEQIDIILAHLRDMSESSRKQIAELEK